MAANSYCTPQPVKGEQLGSPGDWGAACQKGPAATSSSRLAVLPTATDQQGQAVPIARSGSSTSGEGKDVLLLGDTL